MKQHISFKQFNELSQKAKNKLTTWLDKKMYEELEGTAFVVVKDDHPEYRVMQRVTIGRMIEFLDEHGGFMSKHIWRGQEGWVFDSYDDWSLDRTKELCDALFEPVKQILEKE